MSNDRLQRVLRLIVVATLFAVAGCSVNRFNVDVALAEPLRKGSPDLSVEVHLLGLTDQEAADIVSLPLKTYWEEEGRRLNDVPTFAIPLQSRDKPEVTLKSGEDIWNQWIQRGATQLCVIAHYPRPLNDDNGTEPRRKFIRIRSSFLGWGGPRRVDVEVNDSGVIVHRDR